MLHMVNTLLQKYTDNFNTRVGGLLIPFYINFKNTFLNMKVGSTVT